MSTKTIIIKFEHPPIPIRSMDYRASFKGEEEENFCGWGATPQEALNDLLEREGERA